MKTFKEKLILTLKIFFSVILNSILVGIYILYVITCHLEPQVHMVRGMSLFMLMYDLLLFLFTNWAIWTKGVLKKILLILILLSTIGAFVDFTWS